MSGCKMPNPKATFLKYLLGLRSAKFLFAMIIIMITFTNPVKWIIWKMPIQGVVDFELCIAALNIWMFMDSWYKSQWRTVFIMDGAASRVTEKRHDVTFPLLT
jgi:hypothetical protein